MRNHGWNKLFLDLWLRTSSRIARIAPSANDVCPESAQNQALRVAAPTHNINTLLYLN